MAAFATEDDLAAKLRTTVDDTSAELALDLASAAIRDWCGWSITEETVTEAVIDGPGERSLWLPTLRLTAVASVVVAGETLVAGADYDWTSYGKLIRNGRWPCTPRSVTVTYTHGHDPVPDVVKGMCLAIAARGYGNPRGVKSTSETYGPFADGESFASGDALSGDEMATLGRFQLEQVG